MSRTRHHRGQRGRHAGHDYGSRRPGNRGYCNAYGPEGRAVTRRLERAADRRTEHAAMIGAGSGD